MTSHHYLHTGQRTCHADDGREVPCEGSGQDASFGVGASWPEPRFDLRNDEVLDRLTGLIWCRNANLAEFPLTWQEALDFVATMNHEQRFGQRDWRLPNRRELRSLLSLQTKLPALPERHPFIDVFNGWYWTATTPSPSSSPTTVQRHCRWKAPRSISCVMPSVISRPSPSTKAAGHF